MSEEEQSGLFGDAPAKPYLVLARKYRPARFEDLIGQEAMVRTIANSFALDRIPHAYILTGVRGIGKTTTARLLARALNYRTPEIDRPSVKLDPLGEHCPSIMEGRHPDVFEMDAASRTGINDIREILDSVRYAPVSARAKVYIIDEVHMLSTAAFNGLLKTLEEPPPHVKFVFATTEIRKVPVTVLSRCQRFDLKRAPLDLLVQHLGAIAAREGGSLEPEALALLARAADGSVRDGLSLLDQALVQGAEGGLVTAAAVREMLGLADRGRALDLFTALAGGEMKTAILELRAQHEAGADPVLVLKDLLEISHEISMAQALGAEARSLGGEDWTRRIRALAGRVTPAQASRLWQMLLKALEEAGRAPDPLAAAEMAVVRLCAAMGLPPPEEAARLLREGGGGESRAPSAAPARDEGGPRLATFEDAIALLAEHRLDVDLEIDVDRFVRLARYEPGLISFEPAAGAPDNLALRLSRALSEVTGKPWQVRPDGRSSAETGAERRAREQAERMEQLRRHPFVAEALAAFPGAQILSVQEPPAESGGEVVPFRRPARSG